MKLTSCIFLIIIAQHANCVTKLKKRSYLEILDSVKQFRRTNITTTVARYDSDELALLKFYSTIAKYFELTMNIVRYKWINGIKICVSEEKYNAILNITEQLAVDYKIERKDAVQLMIDIMEAYNVIGYSLTSNWYANNTDADKISAVPPEGHDPDMNKIYFELLELQKDLLFQYSKLEDLRTSRTCHSTVSKVIYNHKCSKEGALRRVALQITMCNFCKLNLVHKSPFIRETTTHSKRFTTRKIYYSRRTRIYTPPPGMFEDYQRMLNITATEPPEMAETVKPKAVKKAGKKGGKKVGKKAGKKAKRGKKKRKQ